MKWLEDLFLLVVFVVAIALVTFCVYDGNGYPTVDFAEVVAAAGSSEREMPRAPTPRQKPLIHAIPTVSGEAAPIR